MAAKEWATGRRGCFGVKEDIQKRCLFPIFFAFVVLFYFTSLLRHASLGLISSVPCVEMRPGASHEPHGQTNGHEARRKESNALVECIFQRLSTGELGHSKLLASTA